MDYEAQQKTTNYWYSKARDYEAALRFIADKAPNGLAKMAAAAALGKE